MYDAGNERFFVCWIGSPCILIGTFYLVIILPYTSIIIECLISFCLTANKLCDVNNLVFIRCDKLKITTTLKIEIIIESAFVTKQRAILYSPFRSYSIYNIHLVQRRKCIRSGLTRRDERVVFVVGWGGLGNKQGSYLKSLRRCRN